MGLVQGVEVNAWGTTSHQFRRLAGAIINPEIDHGGIVAAQRIELGQKRVGQFRSAELGEFSGLAGGNHR